MWLSNTTTLELEPFVDCYQVGYAILSHTWTESEVAYDGYAKLRPDITGRFAKVHRTCTRARDYGLQYAWIDTCCINKSSSAELIEAINSIFSWYRNSAVCFAYLADLPPQSSVTGLCAETLARCRWFTRGWTLQELIAPRRLQILDRDWQPWEDDHYPLQDYIARAAGVPKELLAHRKELDEYAVACKMSWATRRETTRREDVAYCLLGLFDINMPLLYGEGHKAFTRLQEEIAKQANDLSLFAWSTDDVQSTDGSTFSASKYRGILALSPAEFSQCGNISRLSVSFRDDQDFAITNKGLSMKAILFTHGSYFVLNLQCWDPVAQEWTLPMQAWLGIFLTRTVLGYVRVNPSRLFHSLKTWHPGVDTTFHVPKHLTVRNVRDISRQYYSSFRLRAPRTAGFEVISAAPAKLWDSARTTFFGTLGDFTGYFHCRTDSQSGPEFEFFVMVGNLSSPVLRLKRFCWVINPSEPSWNVFFRALERATGFADSLNLILLQQVMMDEEGLREVYESSKSTFTSGGSESLNSTISVSLTPGSTCDVWVDIRHDEHSPQGESARVGADIPDHRGIPAPSSTASTGSP